MGRALLFVIGFALSLEMATRIDQLIRHGAPLLGVYSYDSALFEHDEFGIRGRAGGDYEKWQLNGLGLRGPEATLVPEHDVLRVVTLGASETFGLYESPGAEWPRVLEHELRERGLRAEVLNGALAGMTAGAQLRHLHHRLLPLSPDVVIWVVHYAAFADLDPERLERVAAERSDPPDAPGWAAGLRPRIITRLREALMPRLPEFVRERIDAARIGLQLSRLRSRMGTSFGRLETVSDAERAAFGTFLADLTRATEEIGASLIVVLPPRRLDEHSLRLQYLSFPHVARSWLEDSLDEFARVAEQSVGGIGPVVVDLREVFGSEVNQFMLDAVHFNDPGALAVAKGIAPFVEPDAARKGANDVNESPR